MRNGEDVNEQKFMAVFLGAGTLGWLFNALDDGAFLSWLVLALWVILESLYLLRLLTGPRGSGTPTSG